MADNLYVFLPYKLFYCRHLYISERFKQVLRCGLNGIACVAVLKDDVGRIAHISIG